MTDRRLCACPVFQNRSWADDQYCQRMPTQEDLLCDQCREHQASVTRMHAHPGTTSGIHADGGKDGKHHNIGDLVKGSWTLANPDALIGTQVSFSRGRA